MNEGQLLGSEKIGKLLIKFSIPCIISLVLNAVYNMVDQIFIGQGVGYLGNGATNVIFPLVQVATTIALMGRRRRRKSNQPVLRCRRKRKSI